MSNTLLFALNVILLAVFASLLRRKNLLGYAKGGKWYVTWLATAVITLMDELTSVFYAPAEAYRFIGTQAIFFIAFTSLLMRFLSSRMVEIAQILERNNLRGGGVYSFSYLVLGPATSFVAVASIMVAYILTACISTVSAVTNGTAFLPVPRGIEFLLILGIIWGVAVLNIIGIRENARVTFGIFIAAAIVFANLIALGILNIPPQSPQILMASVRDVSLDLTQDGLAHAVQTITIGVASCVLAYSGIESVLQTAGLVESWRDISRAYWFLALTVGIITPVITALALSAPIDFRQHEGDLITYWASMVGNLPFAIVVGLLGSLILIMAVNTAYVASGELLERLAHRYRLQWLAAINRRASLYRIHLLNAVLYTAIILLTRGSQNILAEMYAIGLLASFCINIGCLLLYRYSRGTAEISAYYTSRTGTLLLEIILVACFVYLAFHKPYGTALWGTVVIVILGVGLPFSRRYGPERAEVRQSDSTMSLVLALAETDDARELYFRRPGELEAAQAAEGVAFITFFSPRQRIPEKAAPNHYRFPIQGGSVFGSICALLDLVEAEFTGAAVHVHLGWPLSSWLDRIATGVFVANLMRLPMMFPKLRFSIEYPTGGASRNAAEQSQAAL
jgi:hypothetical protein